MARAKGLSRNMAAFLDMIGWSEIGDKLLAVSDDGYNVIVGSTPTKPKLFDDYAAHPQIYVKSVNSTAAGRYQILGKYATHYMAQLKLPDFAPASQDKIAIQLIRECKAVQLIEDGHIGRAITACKSRWASFEGAGYGQREHSIDDLISHFIAYGGVLAK
nr:PlyM22 [uncultured phage]